MALPARLFHGTSDGYLDQILADGLDPKASVRRYLCYTDDPEIARYHALHMAEHDTDILGRRCRPVCIAIEIERFDETGFRVERNFIRLTPSYGRARGRNLKGRTWTWQSLLEEAGAVGYALRMQVVPKDVRRLRPAIRDRAMLYA